MNEIEQMIQELCPDGVEFRKLGEVCAMQRGTSATRSTLNDGEIPVISGGMKPAFFCDKANRAGETITVAGSGASAGYVMYWAQPIFVCDAFSVKGRENVSTKFVYHVLKNMQDKIQGTKKGGGIPHVHISSIENFLIPVPPIAVQRRIVEILDRFTELDCRKRQYEYYRNHLLTFAGAEDTPPSGVIWKKMSEVFEMRNGYTPSKANAEFWENGNIPWFRMEDIRQNGRKLSYAIQSITEKGVKGKGLFKANSFLLATTATIGEHAWLIVDSLANQRFTNLQIRKSLEGAILPEFVFHYLFIVDEWCKNHTNVSGFASVDMPKLKDLLFPIPPLAEQERIVSILDRFEALTTDLQSGLPAEIAARRQQYEYYRDRLLTFDQKPA